MNNFTVSLWDDGKEILNPISAATEAQLVLFMPPYNSYASNFYALPKPAYYEYYLSWAEACKTIANYEKMSKTVWIYVLYEMFL